jgi:hypothetical protein
MAESQIAGLFMTPEMYRQQQVQDDRMRAMQYAQLAPEDRANYGFAMAGRGLGRALGSLLGNQDPQLQRITEQQRLLQGLDVTDSNSLMQAARQASQAGNTQLAMQLAQQARQAVQDRDVAEQRQLQMNALKRAAAEQERQRARTTEAEQLGATALEQSRTMYGAPAPIVRDDEGSLMPGAAETFRFNITPDIAAGLSATPEGMAVLDRLKKGQAATRPERITAKEGERIFVENPDGSLREIVSAAPPKPQRINFGGEAERVALELYKKEFKDLTQVQQAVVNKRIEESDVRRAPKVVLPTATPQDIAKFRRDVQQTIAPQLATITAANQSLALLKDAREANNPVAYNAARAQLARAFSGGGDLSRREIESAGGDPSIIGTILNTLSTAATGTPTLEQQRNMRKVAEILKKVAINRARGEIRTQRDLAIRSGSSQSDVDLALRFSEFGEDLPAPAAPAGGSSVPSDTFIGIIRKSAQSSQQTTTPVQSRLDAALQKYAPQ